MIPKDKELLMKDLCARLPYGVKVQVYNHWRSEYEYETLTLKNYHELIDTFCVEDVKPYLFPISSMTEEQRLEIEILTNGTIGISQDSLWDFTGYSELSLSTTLELIQWLYENHFDIYGLIPMGLANDATGKNIY